MKANADLPVRAKLFQYGRSQAVRLPKAAMQNLLDALDEFEPGFVMERAQPGQADVRDSLFTGAKH
ncbi:MAG: hypothetical protein GW907_12575 [Betaproteobacteria bacterium]|nr:hypothetical protein [Betaproteobacteria bacterium]NCP83167.1 hypothetical protein [Rhodoferax sp.]NCS62099.1 hypothetical protein [Rhodoferax sp.]PIZ22489.1 MAG: hypothetical protein COY49_08245 [Comamonadaceae bacterium CG_4_10_14_0_8_um_filter_57_29]PJC13003.1 MAG: hypothetical protein CO065_17210 [Comamonadaceae bacterium CG_4_9_14_0_8_um_filter_57_21]